MPCESVGIITLVAKEGDDIKIGGLVAYIDTDAAAPEKSTVESQQSTEKKEAIAEVVKTETKKRNGGQWTIDCRPKDLCNWNTITSS
jgi:pyruvate/2-oxoglutarate dehydrogenase complex dihydrolipoamide acyltransferase (E2) component